MSHKRFWMCLVDGKTAPVVRHPSKMEANDEARRLAKLNTGYPVYVLEVSHYYKVSMPEPELIFPLDE